MKEENSIDNEKNTKIRNYLVAGILAVIALVGLLMPLFYYTGIQVPK
jgi:hypothetical protein